MRRAWGAFMEWNMPLAVMTAVTASALVVLGLALLWNAFVATQ